MQVSEGDKVTLTTYIDSPVDGRRMVRRRIENATVDAVLQPGVAVGGELIEKLAADYPQWRQPLIHEAARGAEDTMRLFLRTDDGSVDIVPIVPYYLKTGWMELDVTPCSEPQVDAEPSYLQYLNTLGGAM